MSKAPFSFRLNVLPLNIVHYVFVAGISASIMWIFLYSVPVSSGAAQVVFLIISFFVLVSSMLILAYALVPNKKRHAFPIHGTDAFKLNINHILNELRFYAPKRYREAITYLPHAEFIPESSIKTPIAESRGIFHIDGSGNKQSVNDSYELLRLAFLYEVGAAIYYYHNEIINTEGRDKAAKKYCHTVLRELGVE